MTSFMTFLQWLWDDKKHTFSILWFYRGPVFVSVLVAILIATAGQFREIFLWSTELFLEIKDRQDWISHPYSLGLFYVVLMPALFTLAMRIMIDWQYYTSKARVERISAKADAARAAAKDRDEMEKANAIDAYLRPPLSANWILHVVIVLPLFATACQILRLFRNANAHGDFIASEAEVLPFLQLGGSEFVPFDYRIELGLILAALVLFIIVACFKPYFWAFIEPSRRKNKSTDPQSKRRENIKILLAVFVGVATIALAVIYPYFGLIFAALIAAGFYFFLTPRILLFARPALLVFLAFLIFFAIRNPLGFSNIGTIPVMTLFAIMLALMVTGATYVEEHFRLPVTIFTIGAVVFFSVLDRNDNHEIRSQSAKVAEVVSPQDPPEFIETELHLAFHAWLSARQDYDPNSAQPYKVYLTAAQGGGLYAAYHSASAMARLQDFNPEFGERLFAVSGVSGGAVGGAIFAGLLNDLDPDATLPEACSDRISNAQDGPFKNAVNCILRRDFLSPAGTALLFRDFFPRGWPWVLPNADRARVMEDAFLAEYANAVGSDDNTLSRSIFNWTPAGKSPLLLLNATDVSAGTRVAISSPIYHFARNRIDQPDTVGNENIAVSRDPMVTYRQVANCPPGRDSCDAPSVATAMLLSARFPIVSPAGYIALRECDDTAHPSYCMKDADAPHKARFVDGGYFENSGLDSIADLLDGLSDVRQQLNVEFEVIVFDFPLAASQARSYGIGELMSPLRALNNSRSARIAPARERVTNTGFTVRSISLDNRSSEFTLGWLLSTQTFNRIDKDVYNHQTCQNADQIKQEVDEKRRPAFQIRLQNCAELRALRLGSEQASETKEISSF